VPIPFSPPLEDATVPTEQTVFERRAHFAEKPEKIQAGGAAWHEGHTARWRWIGKTASISIGCARSDWRGESIAGEVEMVRAAVLRHEQRADNHRDAYRHWAQDKISRFACCRKMMSRNPLDLVRRHGTTNRTARGLAIGRGLGFRCCASDVSGDGARENVARKIKIELEKRAAE